MFNFKHLKLSLSLSSRKFMLSLQSSQVGFGSSFFGSSSFSLLNSLCRQEFLFHLFGFKFLGCFFLLENFEFFSSLFWKNLFILSLFLSISNLLLKFFILFDFNLSLFLLISKLIKKALLLRSLLFLKCLQGFAFNWTSRCSWFLCKAWSCSWAWFLLKSQSLIVSLLGSLFQCFLHCSKFLNFVSSWWFFDCFNWYN